jgi:hypothetical protein
MASHQGPYQLIVEESIRAIARGLPNGLALEGALTAQSHRVLKIERTVEMRALLHAKLAKPPRHRLAETSSPRILTLSDHVTTTAAMAPWRGLKTWSRSLAPGH